MPMKFKQIQAFITVAREGNMTLAAEKMGITQSGLSRLLLSLEADLSASLFERHKHGIERIWQRLFTLRADDAEYRTKGARGN